MKKFPHILQLDVMACGGTCIRIISRFYGKRYSADNIEELCRATHEGVSLKTMSDAAESLGFRVSCGLTTPDKLVKQRPFPCILHWNQNHFVVLYDSKKNFRGKRFFYLSDPSRGLLRMGEEEFRESWLSAKVNGEERGVLMALTPTSYFYKKEGEEQKSRFSSFDFIRKNIRPYKKYLLQLICGLLVGSFIQLLFPFLTQAIVDVGIKHKDLNIIYLILLGQLMLVLSRASVEFIRRWLLLHISTRFNLSVLSDFLVKLTRLPMLFFDTRLTGDLLQRLSDHERIERFVTVQSLNTLFSLFTFIVFGGVLWFYSPLLFLIFIIGSGLYTFWIVLFLNKRRELDYLFFEQRSKSQNKLIQLINSMQELKLHLCERKYRWEWEDLQADLFYTNIKNLKLDQTQESGRIIINEVKNILITVVAATAVINGQLTLGMMLAIQYIVGQLNAPIDQLVQLIHGWQDTSIGLERMNEVHLREDENTRDRDQILAADKETEIRMQDVTFRYDGATSPKVLDNFNLTIPAGRITAIVGASGSGKTTLIKLLLGYYKVKHGKILISGKDIEELDIDWWRSVCGVVMQDGVLFSDTIAHNIAAGEDNSIDTERLVYAARIANIEDFILQLPLKYNTVVGRDGIGLSQGQRQRLLIARAVYKDPKILFMDEATNSLDATNERTIVENLAAYYHGKTAVIVAHRLSTVKNADQIIVMDRGSVVESGKHPELINKKGYYYRLVSNQLELGG